LGGFIGAKDDGDGNDNRSYKTCNAPAKSSPSTNYTYNKTENMHKKLNTRK